MTYRIVLISFLWLQFINTRVVMRLSASQTRSLCRGCHHSSYIAHEAALGMITE